MKPWKVLVLAALVLCVLAGPGSMACAGDKVRGSGDVTRETHRVEGFHGVALKTSGNLYLGRGDREELTIEAEDNLHSYIEFKVDDGILEIRNKHRVSLRPKKEIRFYLTFKHLDTIILSGSGNIEAPDLEGEAIQIDVTGSGDLETGDLEANEIRIELTGSGDMNIAGGVTEKCWLGVTGSGDAEIGDLDADSFRLEISGSGNVEIGGGWADRQDVMITGSGDYGAGDLESSEVEIVISGSGNATIHVRDYLDASISGSGDLYYQGRPDVRQKVTGSGDLRQR